MKTYNILVPTDFSESADLAIEHGLFLARKFDGVLHLLHVAELPTISIPDFPTDLFDIAWEQGMNELKALVDDLEGELPPIKRTVLAGIPARPAAEVILQYAEESEADFIVMGTHGRRGPRRMLLGSVTEEVVRRSPCPVFTVRASRKAWPLPQIQRILVPIDFSGRSRKVIESASRFAEHYGASITLMHAVDLAFFPYYGLGSDPLVDITKNMTESSEERLIEFAAELQAAGIIANWKTVDGHPAETIRSLADEDDFDLIVIGSHGRSGFDRMMVGSISEKVLRSAHCPVLVVNTGDGIKQLEAAA